MDNTGRATSVEPAIAERLVECVDWLLARVGRSTPAGIEASDVVQSAFLKALSSNRRLREPDKLEAWLSRIARNCMVDELRKQERENLLGEDADDVPADEREFGESGKCVCISTQLEELPRSYSDVLRQVFFDGQSPRAIAEQGQTSANAVHVRVHRARQALRRKLTEHCGMTGVTDTSECACLPLGQCVTPTTEKESSSVL